MSAIASLADARQTRTRRELLDHLAELDRDELIELAGMILLDHADVGFARRLLDMADALT